jgi:hypothetical protein
MLFIEGQILVSLGILYENYIVLEYCVITVSQLNSVTQTIFIN